MASTPSSHDHKWTPIPEVSARQVTRYRCDCGAYGYRNWPYVSQQPVAKENRPKVPPIIVYAKGFDVDRYLAKERQDEVDREYAAARTRRQRKEEGISP